MMINKDHLKIQSHISNVSNFRCINSWNF